MNLLHDVSLGKEAPEIINVIIEIGKGSANKYEIDKETGLIALDRAMHTAQVYPVDYGFAPQTYWDDGDALDVVVLTTFPLAPGILVRGRPVGVMNMIDSGEPDAKIIAVPEDDPRWLEVRDLGGVNKHTLKEIEHFFLTYKNLQNKKVEIEGFGDAEEAKKAILRAQKLYSEKFGSKK